MSTANQKGGYYRSIEINRDDKNSSETVLTDAFLTKTNNYLIQVQNFVTSNTQPLNTLDEAMFTILEKGDAGENLGDVNIVPAGVSVFQPTSYFSVLELARQLDNFCVRFSNYLNVVLGDEADRIKFKLNSDGTFSITLFTSFSRRYYIEVGPVTQQMTGFRQYIFASNDGQQDFINNSDVAHLHLFDNNGDFTYDTADILADYTFPSLRPLSTFDTRLSLDVVALGFPISTKPSILDGVESNNYVLARFPTSDYQEMSSEIVTVDGKLANSTVIIENINIGLEDITRKNTEVIANYMFNGTIQHCNFRLDSRYFFDGKLETVPTQVKHGFFSLKLLFSKKVT